jgi:hypothetical protein
MTSCRSGRPVVSAIGVVVIITTAARDQGVGNDKPTRCLDELHGCAKVLGIDELHSRVPCLEPVHLSAQM